MQRAQTRLRPGQQFTKTNDPPPNLGLTWSLYLPMTIMIRAFSLMFALLVLGCGNSTPVAPLGPQRDANLSASLSGNDLILAPSGITFHIPKDWLEWNEKFNNNFHLNSSDMPKVCHGIGEWDTEYAEISNNIFPFQRCVAHIGGGGWGADSVSFGDIQMRVYHLESKIDQIRSQINTRAADSIKPLMDDEHSLMGPKPMVGPIETIDEWKRLLIRYGRFYHDYGDTANIDIRFRSFNSNTIAIVLMYVDRFRNPEEIDGLVNRITGFPEVDGR